MEGMEMFQYTRVLKQYRILLVTLLAYLIFFGVTNLFSTQNASADLDRIPKKQTSPASVYTIQTSSFKDSERAKKHFRMIKQSLQGKALHALRIEKIGRFYAVRIGKFLSLEEAKQFLNKHKFTLEGAMLMKAYLIDERILLMHDGRMEDVPESIAAIQRFRFLPHIPYVQDDLDLKLVGTALVDVPGNSIAIIEDLATGGQEIYKKGDTLKGVFIKKILGKGVIIDKGKGDEILTMTGGSNTRQTKTPESQLRRYQPREKRVDAADRTYKAMKRGIGIRTYKQNGQPVGFAIFNIEPNSIFSKVGLENCDVITAVNGNPIDVSREPSHFYKTFEKGGEITVDIKRDDTDQQLSFEIK